MTINKVLLGPCWFVQDSCYPFRVFDIGLGTISKRYIQTSLTLVI